MVTFVRNKPPRPVLVLAAVTLIAARGARAAGSFDVCAEPVPENSARAGYDLYEKASPAGRDLARDNWSADLAVRTRGDWLVGGAYRGTFVDESDPGFRTNGYLHGFYFVLHRLRTAERRLRWAVAPALSGSSNVTKDPDQYDADAWQLNLAAVWEWPRGETFAWRAGLCADHRFGRYRAYPVAGVAWRPRADWRIEAGFPDTRISYRPGGALETSVAVYPNGNEWYVKDDSLEFASMFEYRAWAAELAVTWRVSAVLALTAVAGVDFSAEYTGDLMDGSRTTLDLGSVGRIGVDLTWRFRD